MADLPSLKTVSSAKVAPQAGFAPNKAAIYFMAILVSAVMIAWFGLLAWGAFALCDWAIDVLRSGFSHSAELAALTG